MSAGDAMADLEGWLAGTTWFVFGAQALAVWGVPRQTLDIDITVAFSTAELSARIARLSEWRLTARPEDPLAFASRNAVLPLKHQSGITIDLVLAGTDFERAALARARTAEVLGRMVPVVGPEDLLVYKLGSDRPQDSNDARGIIARQGALLDAPAVRRNLRELEIQLDRSDLVSEFDVLLARARRQQA